MHRTIHSRQTSAFFGKYSYVDWALSDCKSLFGEWKPDIMISKFCFQFHHYVVKGWFSRIDDDHTQPALPSAVIAKNLANDACCYFTIVIMNSPIQNDNI